MSGLIRAAGRLLPRQAQSRFFAARALASSRLAPARISSIASLPSWQAYSSTQLAVEDR
jgi:hypothetical protein